LQAQVRVRTLADLIQAGSGSAYVIAFVSQFLSNFLIFSHAVLAYHLLYCGSGHW
jgi:hypothetical protein